MNCQRCDVAALYYRDTTNHKYLCRPCWDGLLEGEAMTSKKNNDTFDLDTPAAAASTALATANELAPTLLALRVTTPAEAQFATDVAHQVRETKRGLEAERDAAVKPLNAVVKKIRGWFKPAIERLEEIEGHLRVEIMRHRQALEAAQAAALATATTHAEVAQAVAVLAPKPVGLSERTAWKWEVADAAAIPAEYYVLDTARIDREVRASKDQTTIPGIRVIREAVAVLR